MVLSQTEPFTHQEIKGLSERYKVYIKTVIDIEKKICCAGVSLHSDGEKILIDTGSSQRNIWGGGIDLTTKNIDWNAIINIRPNFGNSSDEIQDQIIRNKFEELSKYFFKVIYD